MDLLSQLRDIKLPPAISIWPLTPGWYVLIAVLLIFLSVTIFFIWKAYQKKHVKRVILKQLELLRNKSMETFDEAQTQPKTSSADIVMELSALLKRAALHAYSRERVAGLSGCAWLKFLDQTFMDNSDVFTNGAGRILVDAPYQRDVEKNPSALIILIEKWVKINL